MEGNIKKLILSALIVLIGSIFIFQDVEATSKEFESVADYFLYTFSGEASDSVILTYVADGEEVIREVAQGDEISIEHSLGVDASTNIHTHVRKEGEFFLIEIEAANTAGVRSLLKIKSTNEQNFYDYISSIKLSAQNNQLELFRQIPNSSILIEEFTINSIFISPSTGFDPSYEGPKGRSLKIQFQADDSLDENIPENTASSGCSLNFIQLSNYKSMVWLCLSLWVLIFFRKAKTLRST